MTACVIAAAVLLVQAVSVLGLEKLPAIPEGHRAQYYVLKDDGAYVFGYDTGEGQRAAVSADRSNQVQGQYSYVDRAGKRVSVEYTAGESGFVPRLQEERTGARGVGVTGLGPGHAVEAFKTPVASYSQSYDSDDSDHSYDATADDSYSFSTDTDSYKRTAKGNIRGQYSNSQAGGSHALSYIAGQVTSSESTAGTGARSGSLSSKTSPTYYTGPTADARSNHNNDGSYSFSFSTDDQSRRESADSQNNVRGSYSFKAKEDGETRRVDYKAGAATGFIATGSHLPVPSKPSVHSSFGQSLPKSFEQNISSLKGSRPASYSYFSSTATPQGGVGSDGSYTFAYNARDSSRQESGDVQNNVRGSFTFKSKDDGKTRRVDYEAGAAAGFIAKGSHLPSALNPLSSVSTGGYSEILSSKSSGHDYSGTSLDYLADEVSSGDASYSFAYNAGDQFRRESSDVQGNINGQYSFLGTDGVQRKVDYSAGAGKGFVVKVASPVTSYSSEAGISSTGLQSGGSHAVSYNAGEHSRQELPDPQDNVRRTYSDGAKNGGQRRLTNYAAGAAIGIINKNTGSGYSSFPSRSSVRADSVGLGTPVSSSGVQSDGSYSFSYQTADQSRQESGDAENNVSGSFTFKAKDDGKTRRVDYTAGAATGFIAQGAHIPKGPTAPSSEVDAAGTVLSHGKHFASSPHIGSFVSETPKSSYASYFSHNSGDHSREKVSDTQDISISHDDRSSGDASYSYSYQTDSSSKHESSDAQGNVVGTFSFLGGDGVSRSVHYTSRGDEGFVVSGEHLPKGVSGSAAGASADVGAFTL